jgi:hypothetical protein
VAGFSTAIWSPEPAPLWAAEAFCSTVAMRSLLVVACVGLSRHRV